MDLKDRIKKMAKECSGRLVELRRHFHAYPELSFQEKETSSFIQKTLDQLGVPYTIGWAGYGLVARIDGAEGGDLVALRADMDALPIQERNEVPYASTQSNVMHACGHDVHMTVQLGAIMILTALKQELRGSVMCVFQPGEEKLPGGASMMIDEGLFEREKPRVMYGLHVHPPMNVGKVGLKPGLYMASADEIYVSFKGKGGHAAIPQECIDPVIMASSFIQQVQTVISRNNHPGIPAVLTFGKINTIGGATNIIPNEVRLEGTLRMMDEEWRRRAHEDIQRIAQGVAHTFGGHIDVEIKIGYPCLINDESETNKARTRMVEFLGESHVEDLPMRMSAEDFAFYTHHVPCCFYRLGTRNEGRGMVHSVHTDRFDVDEKSLEVGAGMMAWLAYKALSD